MMLAVLIALANPTFAAGGGTWSSSSNFYSSSPSGNDSYGSPDRFAAVNTLIRLEKFTEVQKARKLMPVKSDEADRLNLLGFTAHKSGNLRGAGTLYKQALMINPRHTNALEYQGELFLQLRQIKDAEYNLEKLQKICCMPCSAERKLRSQLLHIWSTRRFDLVQIVHDAMRCSCGSWRYS